MMAEKEIQLLRIHHPYTCAPPVINQAPNPVKVINLFPPETPPFTPRTRSKKSRQDNTGKNPLRKIITLGATIVLPSPSSHRRRPRSTRKLSLFVIPVPVKDKRYLGANLPHSNRGTDKSCARMPRRNTWSTCGVGPLAKTPGQLVCHKILPPLHGWVEVEDTTE